MDDAKNNSFEKMRTKGTQREARIESTFQARSQPSKDRPKNKKKQQKIGASGDHMNRVANC